MTMYDDKAITSPESTFLKSYFSMSAHRN